MNNELRQVMIAGLFLAIGIMWLIGGIALVLAGFEEHWALGWLSLFIWLWGCSAAAIYFKVQRFFA